jgi:epoxide hydrolase
MRSRRWSRQAAARAVSRSGSTRSGAEPGPASATVVAWKALIRCRSRDGSIVEKFQDWTDPAAELPEDAVDRDRILTDVSIYWFTGTAGSAAHTYYERFNDPAMWLPRDRGTVHTAVAVFSADVAIRPFASKLNNVVHWSEFDRGGHFAALEAPDLLTADIRDFFRSLA